MLDAMCEFGYAWRECLKSFGCANEVLRGVILKNRFELNEMLNE